MAYLDLSGTTLGNYQIIEEIGRGGMAVVYRAHQPSLNRDVAIKVLPPQFAFDQAFVLRFQREARAAAGLRHPHIVVIYDVGQDRGLHYIVMEYLAGRTLAELIRQEGPLPPSRAAHIADQIALALDYAHRQGLVHRDVKPANIFVGEGDHVTLTDFGIAKAATGTQLTRTGMLVGTPEYMSPEQAQSHEIDHRTDVYSLGIVLYEMLTGRVPFRADTPISTLLQHAQKPPPSLRAVVPGLSREVESVVLRALSKDPARRYQSAGDLARAVRSAAERGGQAPPTQAHAAASGLLDSVDRRVLLIGSGIVFIVLLLAGILLLPNIFPRPDDPRTAPGDDPAPARTATRTTAADATSPPTVATEPTSTPDRMSTAVAATLTASADLAPSVTDTPTPSATSTTPPSSTPRPTATPTDRPTQPPTPSATSTTPPSSTPRPTATPDTRTPTSLPPTEPPSGYVLDNFERYSSSAALQSAYSVNTAWGQNVGQVSLGAPPNIRSGGHSLSFYYEIRNAAPDDYAGFERSFSPQDWRSYSLLHLWVKSDRSPRDLIIQFRETSGEVWRYRVNLSTFSARDWVLPLNESTFHRADWAPYQNNRIDLNGIEYYGFFVGDGGLGSGTIFVDDISLE